MLHMSLFPFHRSKQIVFFAVAFIGLFFFACKSLQNNPAAVPAQPNSEPAARVLVFIKTKGYYHESIPTGAGAIQQMGMTNNFIADTTSDASVFIEDSLKNYQAVVFLNTTMNVLNADQQ